MIFGLSYPVIDILLQTLVWAAMLATLLISQYQLRAMRGGAEAQNTIALINYLQMPDIRAARTTVIRQLNGRRFPEWADEERQAADLVCSSYQAAAILILKQKIVPQAVFVESWGPSIVRCYEILREYVEDLQRTENAGPYYWKDFRALYEASKKRLGRRGPTTMSE